MNYKATDILMQLKYVTRRPRIDTPDVVALKNCTESSDSSVIDFAKSFLHYPDNYFGRTVARFYDGSAEVTFYKE